MYFIIYAATDYRSHPFPLPVVHPSGQVHNALLSRGIIDHIFQTFLKFLLLVANNLQILLVMANILLKQPVLCRN